MKDDRFPELKSQKQLDKKPIQWDTVAVWVSGIAFSIVCWFYFIAWLAS